MRKVVIDMQAIFATTVEDTLKLSEFEFYTFKSKNPEQTLQLCKDVMADILIMDVTSFYPRTLEQRLKIRNSIKNFKQSCKVVFMVDEVSEKNMADEVRIAKKMDLLIILFITLHLQIILLQL